MGIFQDITKAKAYLIRKEKRKLKKGKSKTSGNYFLYNYAQKNESYNFYKKKFDII